MPLSEQVLGGFKTGMTRGSRRGGKEGAQKLWTLQNGWVNDQGDVVPRPGLQHVANVANSAGLYGADGQLHVFHSGEQGYIDPPNPLVQGHILRYPIPESTLSYQDTVLADEPYLLYPLNDPTNTAIEVVQGFNGTYQGTSFQRQRASLLPNGEGGSAEFTSLDAFVQTPLSTVLSALEYPFTVEGWIQFDQPVTNLQVYSLLVADEFSPEVSVDYNGRGYLRRHNSGNFDLSTGEVVTVGSIAYVVAVSELNAMRFYVNGSLVGSTSYGLESGGTLPVMAFKIGALHSGLSEGNKRNLQMLAVYQKALTTEQVVNHWIAAQ